MFMTFIPLRQIDAHQAHSFKKDIFVYSEPISDLLLNNNVYICTISDGHKTLFTPSLPWEHGEGVICECRCPSQITGAKKQSV